MGTDRKEGWDECTLFLYQSLFVARSTLLSNLSPLTKSLEQASVPSSVSAEMHVDQALNDNRNYRLKWKLDNMKSLHGFLRWNVVCTAVLRKIALQKRGSVCNKVNVKLLCYLILFTFKHCCCLVLLNSKRSSKCDGNATELHSHKADLAATKG